MEANEKGDCIGREDCSLTSSQLILIIHILGEIPSKKDIPPPSREEACIALAKPVKPKGKFKSTDSEKRFKQYVGYSMA